MWKNIRDFVVFNSSHTEERKSREKSSSFLGLTSVWLTREQKKNTYRYDFFRQSWATYGENLWQPRSSKLSGIIQQDLKQVSSFDLFHDCFFSFDFFCFALWDMTYKLFSYNQFMKWCLFASVKIWIQRCVTTNFD